MSNENPLNLKQPAEQVIAELINRGNRGLRFTSNDLTYGLPKQANNTAGGDTETRNTWLPVTVNSTDITTEINYGRLDLAQRPGLQGLEIPFDNQTSTADLIDALNEASGLLMTGDDILNTELTGLDASSLPYSAIIRARVDRSLLVIGQVEVLIVAEGEDEEEPPVEEPGDDLTVIEPVDMSSELPEQFTDDAGMMIHGTNNPVTDMVLADNNEIQIGGAARIYRDINTYAPDAENIYRLDVDEVADWNFPTAIGLLDTRNGTRITDLYDVNLQAIGPDGALSFDLRWNDDTGSYDLVDDVAGLNITDGVTAQDGAVYQEIQRLSFYTEHLGAVDLTESGVPYGEFEFIYTATRKDERASDGQVTPEPVVARFTAIVDYKVTEPEPDPEPDPEPGEIVTNAFVVDQETAQQGDVVTFTLNLVVEGDTAVQAPLQWGVNFTGMSMTAPVNVTPGLTLLAQLGATETSIFATSDLAPGHYEVVFTATVDVWGEQDPEDPESVPSQIRLDTVFTAAEGDPIQSSVEIELAE